MQLSAMRDDVRKRGWRVTIAIKDVGWTPNAGAMRAASQAPGQEGHQYAGNRHTAGDQPHLCPARVLGEAGGSSRE